MRDLSGYRSERLMSMLRELDASILRMSGRKLGYVDGVVYDSLLREREAVVLALRARD